MLTFFKSRCSKEKGLTVLQHGQAGVAKKGARTMVYRETL